MKRNQPKTGWFLVSHSIMCAIVTQASSRRSFSAGSVLVGDTPSGSAWGRVRNGKQSTLRPPRWLELQAATGQSSLTRLSTVSINAGHFAGVFTDGLAV